VVTILHTSAELIGNVFARRISLEPIDKAWRLSWLVGMKSPPSSGIRRQPLFGGTYLGSGALKERPGIRPFVRRPNDQSRRARPDLSASPISV
jgi:hypothetical protein